jgi:nucleoid-associated protein YgaU
VTPRASASLKATQRAERRALRTRGGISPAAALANRVADRLARDAALRGRAEAAQPAAGEVVLISDDARLLVHAQLDDGYMHREGGYGGWTDVERPGRVSATVFTGAPSLRLPLRLILGGWPTDPGRSGMTCAQAIRELEAIARQPLDAPRGAHPPLLRVRGNVPHGNTRWFVDELEWSSAAEDTLVERGQVVRTAVTVTLKRYAQVDLLVRRAPPEPPARRYRVKRGDRLETIAKEQCGASGQRAVKAMVARIKRLNGLRDGRSIKPGDVLRLPPR